MGVGGVGAGAAVEGAEEEVAAGPGSSVQDAYSGYSEITREKLSQPLETSCLIYQQGRTLALASHVGRREEKAESRHGNQIMGEFQGAISLVLLSFFSMKVSKNSPASAEMSS